MLKSVFSSMPKNSLIIIGAGGYIGSAILRGSLNDDYESIIAIYRSKVVAYKKAGCFFSVTTYKSIVEIARAGSARIKVDVVYCVSGQTPSLDMTCSHSTIIREEVDALTNYVISIQMEADVQKFILISSVGAMFGRVNNSARIKESSCQSPASFYGLLCATKEHTLYNLSLIHI